MTIDKTTNKRNSINVINKYNIEITYWYYFKRLNKDNRFIYSLNLYNLITGEKIYINKFKRVQLELLNKNDIKLIIFNYLTRTNNKIKYLYLTKKTIKKLKKIKKK